MSYIIWRFPNGWGYPHHPVVMDRLVLKQWWRLGVPHDLAVSALQGSALLELLWLEWISQPIFMACGCVWKRGIPMKIFTLMRNTVIQHQNLLGFHWIFRQTHGLPFLGPRSKWAAPQFMHDFRYVQILKITSHECLSRLDPKFENLILDKAIRYCWLMLADMVQMIDIQVCPTLESWGCLNSHFLNCTWWRSISFWVISKSGC